MSGWAEEPVGDVVQEGQVLLSRHSLLGGNAGTKLPSFHFQKTLEMQTSRKIFQALKCVQAAL